MKKTVIELFAGVGGFRIGLNNITSIDENGRAIENGDFEFVWANQWEPSTKIQHAFDCYNLRFNESNNCNMVDSLAKIIQLLVPYLMKKELKVRKVFYGGKLEIF